MTTNEHLERRTTIQVLGDPIIDWLIAVPAAPLSVLAPYALPETTAKRYSNEHVCVVVQRGGALLVQDLLVEAASLSERSQDQHVKVKGSTLSDSAARDLSFHRVPRTVSLWNHYPQRLRRKTLVWRMTQSLGDNPVDESNLYLEFEHVAETPATAVIADSARGFRNRVDAWPNWLADRAVARPAHIILKATTAPICRGDLWQSLINGHSDVLTIICSVAELRAEKASIGDPLSWERTASDVRKAVLRRSGDLARARRVIVWLGSSGAVILERGEVATLVFDPLHQEGDWEAIRPGVRVNIGTCLSAALALETARNPDKPNWTLAVSRGLEASRIVHEKRIVNENDSEALGCLTPFKAAALAISTGSGDEFHCAEFSDQDSWHIINSVYRSDTAFLELAHQIVIEGPELACRQIPLEKINHWYSVDRTEIESIRSARVLMRRFMAQDTRIPPLSLAVFGPPGSGKSFITRQLTSGLETSRFKAIEVLPFNLSQFRDIGDLAGAFQQIRYLALKEHFPVVVWDEFDSNFNGELGWLSKFLAPMQDGEFMDAGLGRPFGPCIFIFAGGTSETMLHFRNRVLSSTNPGIKGKDFLSRLRGYIDILGANPVLQTEPMQPESKVTDPITLLRRAILLRAMLRINHRSIFKSRSSDNNQQYADIDEGILNAFLVVGEYAHATRSMEAIVKMSSVGDRLRLERSGLPPDHQLALHVNADQFLRIVNELPDTI